LLSASVSLPLTVCVSPKDELGKIPEESIDPNLVLAVVIVSLPKGKKDD